MYRIFNHVAVPGVLLLCSTLPAFPAIINAPAAGTDFGCGMGLTCRFIIDNAEQGSFLLTRVGALGNIFRTSNDTFVSDSGYWEIIFTIVQESTGTNVGIAGQMRHLKKPPAHTDTDPGRPFNFGGEVTTEAGKGSVRRPAAAGTFTNVKHRNDADHDDRYFNQLSLTRSAAGAVTGYTLYVAGAHDKDPLPLPEPGTWLLLGTGLAAIVLRRTAR